MNQETCECKVCHRCYQRHCNESTPCPYCGSKEVGVIDIVHVIVLLLLLLLYIFVLVYMEVAF